MGNGTQAQVEGEARPERGGSSAVTTGKTEHLAEAGQCESPQQNSLAASVSSVRSERKASELRGGSRCWSFTAREAVTCFLGGWDSERPRDV